MFRSKILWWGAVIIIIILLLYIYKYISRPPELAKTFTTPLVMRKNQQKPEHSNSPQRNQERQIGNMLVKEKTNKTRATKPVKKVNTPIKSAPIVNAKKPIHTKNKQVNKNNALFDHVMQEKLLVQKEQVLKINANNYTLQLLATPDLHIAEKLIIRHQIQSTGMIVQTRQRQKLWYIVIYGVFPTRQQAHAAVKDLHLKPSQFWIRSYKSVHKAMRAVMEKSS